MTTWRYFARKTLPIVVRELGLPAATSRPDLTVCPLHQGEPIGVITHLCKRCFDAAWAEVGRRYAAANQGGPNRGATP